MPIQLACCHFAHLSQHIIGWIISVKSQQETTKNIQNRTYLFQMVRELAYTSCRALHSIVPISDHLKIIKSEKLFSPTFAEATGLFCNERIT